MFLPTYYDPYCYYHTLLGHHLHKHIGAIMDTLYVTDFREGLGVNFQAGNGIHLSGLA